MDKLKLSKDRKVANSLTPSGTVRIANSLGLPAGKKFSCPGATSVCEKVCYAGKLERMPYLKSLRDNLAHNWALLKDATTLEMFDLLTEAIDNFEVECEKWNAPKMFRIHWDGDFFSAKYVAAWYAVIQNHPNVQFWAYTRVESAIKFLKGLDNLAIYFSGDSENAPIASKLESQGFKIAMLGNTFNEAKTSLQGISAMCPELKGNIPLNGACVSCGLCIKGRHNITFSITKK